MRTCHHVSACAGSNQLQVAVDSHLLILLVGLLALCPPAALLLSWWLCRWSRCTGLSQGPLRSPPLFLPPPLFCSVSHRIGACLNALVARPHYGLRHAPGTTPLMALYLCQVPLIRWFTVGLGISTTTYLQLPIYYLPIYYYYFYLLLLLRLLPQASQIRGIVGIVGIAGYGHLCTACI